MQPAEKITTRFVLKLLLLFVLLFFGVMLKVSKMTAHANAQDAKVGETPAMDTSNMHLKQSLYFRLVNHDKQSANI